MLVLAPGIFKNDKKKKNRGEDAVAMPLYVWVYKWNVAAP
jgi:hypothetical protein